MADENERSRIAAIIRELAPEFIEKVAAHPILAEFREVTRGKLEDLAKDTGQIAKLLERTHRDLRGLDRRVAAQEAITNGQRIRLEAAERGYAQVSESVGRVSERQERNSARLEGLEKQERIVAEIERQARDKPATSAQSSWTDVPLKILIAAMLIGMALGKAGFDPSVWFK